MREREADFSVHFLADGAHHEVYEVSSSTWSTTYLFRVALPVDPQLKLQSEMATLMFLKQKTGIPVPRPVAWSSTRDRRLDYEWALVEKLPDVELRDVWHEMTLDQKSQVVETIAGFLVQLWGPSNRLDGIGSLYVNHATPLNFPLDQRDIDEIGKDGFTIGPSVDGTFFAGRRLYLSANRGPYESCRDWPAALIHVEQEFIRTAKLLLDTKSEMTPEHISEDWDKLVDEIGIDEDDFLEEYEDMTATCREYERVLPLVFPPHDNPQTEKLRFSLHHCDLRAANILVDPENLSVTGVIDWEQTCSVPDWYGVNYPLLINKDDPISDGEPPVPVTYDVDSAEYNPARVAERDRWEAKILRERFDCAVEKSSGSKDWRPTDQLDGLKSRFIRGVAELSGFWERSRNQLNSIVKDLEALQIPEDPNTTSDDKKRPGA